ncbi:hypothetical protein GYMLUDRAFT_45127 [Collybiopsis luxurians FD-317 M1]|uniref:Uncharacterized protein n=1 Tax=Collybiopsis luxurians FD-317 M1 TaxID=944289 RepID=A0A0D0B619_9AGAR|nr:hypothetical protein GYMLUDRAFT_45127 [Collybiopsis luxurians FD-317 M1]
MTITDDLPWPDLGSITRGATRGNQGQKGTLGPPDPDGRCIVQLRVHPGALEIRLNRQSSDWYRILDGEVDRALSLTRTYWRKARRRQDYDQRGDQDHMELHEWLQQLKDKTLANLELLTQKGAMKGPPYILPDDYELPLLRKFIERHTAGTPHNPRLRNNGVDDGKTNFIVQQDADIDTKISEPGSSYVSPETSINSSPALANGKPLEIQSLLHQAVRCNQEVQNSRAALEQARKNTHDAFLHYCSCREEEMQAQKVASTAEERRDDFVEALLLRNTQKLPLESTITLEEVQAAYALAHYRSTETIDQEQRSIANFALRPVDGPWGNVTAMQVMYPTDTPASLEVLANPENITRSRKRSWERHGQMQLEDTQDDDMLNSVELSLPNCHDEQTVNLPPRKRVHAMIPGYGVDNNQTL